MFITNSLFSEAPTKEAVEQLFNDWRKPLARRLLKMANISTRNWTMYMRHRGFDVGEAWSFAQLAEEYGCSRPRAYQIVSRTEEKFEEFCKKMGLRNVRQLSPKRQ